MSSTIPGTYTYADPIPPAAGSVDELTAALAAAQAELEQPRKSKTADAGTYRYSYADLADVVAAALAVLPKHGVAVMQDARTDLAAGSVLCTTTLRKGHQALSFGPLELPIARRDVQGIGSAITYARRYQLAAALGIAAEADDDGAAASEPATRPQSVAKAPKLVDEAVTTGSRKAGSRTISGARVAELERLGARKGQTPANLADWASRHYDVATIAELDVKGGNALAAALVKLEDVALAEAVAKITGAHDAAATVDVSGTAPAAASSESTRTDAAGSRSAGVGTGDVGPHADDGDAGAPDSGGDA